jgi:hypothetical protein
MPETCRGTLIQYTKNKECIELVVIHIIHDARSTQHNSKFRVPKDKWTHYFRKTYLNLQHSASTVTGTVPVIAKIKVSNLYRHKTLSVQRHNTSCRSCTVIHFPYSTHTTVLSERSKVCKTPTFSYLWQWTLRGAIIYICHLAECRNQFNWSILSFGFMNNLSYNTKVMAHNMRIKVQLMNKVQRSSKINHTILGNSSHWIHGCLRLCV